MITEAFLQYQYGRKREYVNYGFLKDLLMTATVFIDRQLYSCGERLYSSGETI